MGARWNLGREYFAHQAGRCALAKLTINDGGVLTHEPIYSWLLRQAGRRPGSIVVRDKGVEALLRLHEQAAAAQKQLFDICDNHRDRMI